MTGPRKSSDVTLAVVFHQMLDRLDGAPSPPRCARCGHELAKHYLSSTGIPPIPVCTACPGFAAPAKEFGWRHSFVPPAEQEGT